MHHAHDDSKQRAPRARAVAVPQVPHATSVEVALLFVLLALLALLL